MEDPHTRGEVYERVESYVITLFPEIGSSR
jgi:hypothetical protein